MPPRSLTEGPPPSQPQTQAHPLGPIGFPHFSAGASFPSLFMCPPKLRAFRNPSRVCKHLCPRGLPVPALTALSARRSVQPSREACSPPASPRARTRSPRRGSRSSRGPRAASLRLGVATVNRSFSPVPADFVRKTRCSLYRLTRDRLWNLPLPRSAPAPQPWVRFIPHSLAPRAPPGSPHTTAPPALASFPTLPGPSTLHSLASNLTPLPRRALATPSRLKSSGGAGRGGTDTRHRVLPARATWQLRAAGAERASAAGPSLRVLFPPPPQPGPSPDLLEAAAAAVPSLSLTLLLRPPLPVSSYPHLFSFFPDDLTRNENFLSALSPTLQPTKSSAFIVLLPSLFYSNLLNN